jgi:hypothetical protein
MTEAEWNQCENPGVMMEHLGDRATLRKVRLFNSSSVRLLCGPTKNEKVRSILAVAEQMADGIASRTEIIQARWAARRIKQEFPPAPQDEPVWNCDQAVTEDPFRSFHGIQVCTTCFVSPGLGPEWRAAMWRDTSTWVRLLRELFGNPFRPVAFDTSWLTPIVTALAQAIYADRAFDRLPILADALEDAGCTNQDILAHCRGGGEHVRGCWVVDLLTRRE